MTEPWPESMAITTSLIHCCINSGRYESIIELSIIQVRIGEKQITDTVNRKGEYVSKIQMQVVVVYLYLCIRVYVEKEKCDLVSVNVSKTNQPLCALYRAFYVSLSRTIPACTDDAMILTRSFTTFRESVRKSRANGLYFIAGKERLYEIATEIDVLYKMPPLLPTIKTGLLWRIKGHFYSSYSRIPSRFFALL